MISDYLRGGIFITIEQIKYFLAINKFKSFSIAAEELCISQSSLSKQIKSLEIELDTSLFNRTTRNINLSESGKEFLIHATRLLDDYDNTLLSMEKYSNKKKSTLNIGTIPVISQYKITSFIALFKNKYPNIHINIIEGERDQILDMINKSEVDFAFIRDFNLKEDFFNVYPLVSDELVLITSKNHHFSNKKYVTLEDAKDEDFIFLNSASGIDSLCIEQCNKHGFSPNITYSVNKIETILGLVEENFGITLLMNKTVSCFNRDKISINLLKESVTNNLSLIYRKDKKLSSNEVLFKDFIIESTKREQ